VARKRTNIVVASLHREAHTAKACHYNLADRDDLLGLMRADRRVQDKRRAKQAAADQGSRCRARRTEGHMSTLAAQLRAEVDEGVNEPPAA
jgi:hypothetical protein